MKALRIANLNFLHWHRNPKYAVVILYLVMYSFERLNGLVAYARDIGEVIHPWIFPFMPCFGAGFLPLMLGFVLLVSDAPFRTRQQGLIMQRTGKRAWLAGQLLYLFLVSLGFTVLMWVLSWLWVLPELHWNMDWGRTLTSAAINGIPLHYRVYLEFPYAVLKNNDPLTVTLWCAASMTSVCFLLGVIMAGCNLWLRKGWGTAIMAILTSISLIPDLYAATPGPIRFVLWFSPLTWMDYSLMGHTEQYLPSHAYGILCPAILALGLSVLLLLTVGKCNIDTDKE